MRSNIRKLLYSTLCGILINPSTGCKEEDIEPKNKTTETGEEDEPSGGPEVLSDDEECTDEEYVFCDIIADLGEAYDDWGSNCESAVGTVRSLGCAVACCRGCVEDYEEWKYEDHATNEELTCEYVDNMYDWMSALDTFFSSEYDCPNVFCRKEQDGTDFCCYEPLIESEEEGIRLLEEILTSLGYETEIQDGSWTVYVENGTRQLTPDIRFTGHNTGYSYLEFNSTADPGEGYSSDLPFYKEIDPGTEDSITVMVNELLSG